MNKVKILIARYFSNFAYFYGYLGYRLFVILALSIVVGVLDGFGLAMFVPLLEFASRNEGESEVVSGASDTMGNLSFLVDGIAASGLPLTVITVLLVMLGFFLLKGGAKFIELYTGALYIRFFGKTMRESNVLGLARYRFDRFVNADVGQIQNTLTSEVGRVVSAYRYYVSVIQNTILIVVYTGLAFLANPQFALFIVVGGFLSNLLFTTLYNATKRYSRTLTAQVHQYYGLMMQQVAQFKYLKATGLSRFFAGKLIKKIRAMETTQLGINTLNAMISSLREPLMMTVVVVVILLEITLLGGELGVIILSILFFYRALFSVTQLQTKWNQFLGMTGSIENMTAFRRKLAKGEESVGERDVERFDRAITLEGVSFSYGGAVATSTVTSKEDTLPEQGSQGSQGSPETHTPKDTIEPKDANEPKDALILRDINLEIPKNETIAFVGESGSGKTTLINLIAGLLQPDEGMIRIDDTDLSSINTTSYQRRIGYITQEPVIFSDTIFNNVTFWDRDTNETREAFWRALEKAHIAQFVRGLPDKEQAMLGNNGINLSGGQRQRLSIARELYKSVDILLMDEATSALDSETEAQIQANMEALKGQYTILMIAHRLSTIRHADRVVLLERGAIRAQGTYAELLEGSPEFQRMVQMQEVG
jgi:subfamily B ATP-binding cassette protein MsbA